MMHTSVNGIYKVNLEEISRLAKKIVVAVLLIKSKGALYLYITLYLKFGCKQNTFCCMCTVSSL